MQYVATELINEKVWWHRTLWWRNLSARCAVFYTFMLEGIFMGVWSFFLADIEDRLNLSDAELGTAVLFVYFGMVLVSGITAYILKVYGSQFSMCLGALGFGISLSFIPLATTLGLLIFTMLLYGCTMGIMDISMNSGAILTEIVAGMPLLGSFHGSYSVAAAIGSLVGAALASSNLGIVAVFAGFSVTSVVMTLILHANIYNFRQEEIITDFKNENHGPPEDVTEYSPFTEAGSVDEDGGSKQSALHTPLVDERDDHSSQHSLDDLTGDSPPAMPASTKWIIAFYSMVGFLAAFGESSIVTWSIVYFDRELDASSVMKSLGFSCFMVCMALGRFSCDYLRSKFGRRLIVRVGGFLACGGLLLVVLAPDLPGAIAFACLGFCLTGMGLSTLIPTMFSSAGHIPGGMHAGTSIAIVSMFTNCGAICSSPLVGVISDLFGSMRLAFMCDALLIGLICPLGWGIPEESHVFRKSSRGSRSSADMRRTSKDEFLVSHSEPM
jgi:MFS family permease